MTKLTAIALLTALSLAGCEMMPVTEKGIAQESLYNRLGGRPAITAVVGEFTARITADNRINKHIAKTDLPKLKFLLAEQICDVSGGPCKYSGRTMPDTHKGMKITQQEFIRTGEHLAAALDKFKVSAKDKEPLLNTFGGLQNDIIGL